MRVAAQESAEREKRELSAEIAALQEKLLVGDRSTSVSIEHEEKLRRTEQELKDRRQQEEILAKELEEANSMIEEQYASMAEEVRRP